MTIRRKIFFDYVLPNIDKAYCEGHKIIHFVAASDMLPEWMKRCLDDAASTYPWLRVCYVTYEENWTFDGWIRGEVEREARSSGETMIFSSGRLDDDDILSPRYFSEVDKYLNEAFIGFCLSFPTGYSAIWDFETEAYSKFSQSYLEKVAIGLSFINKVTPHEGVLKRRVVVPGNHKKIDLQLPTVLDGRFNCYIRSLHDENDSHYERLRNNVPVRMIDAVNSAESEGVGEISKEFLL